VNQQARKIEGTEGENHASFLDRFVLKITPEEREKLDFSYDCGKYGHRNQPRETGARYFEHLRGGALIFIDELGITDTELIAAFFLHDILEDSFLFTPKRIKMVFGERVCGIVVVVTKPKKNDPRFSSKAEGHEWYYAQISSASIDVKLVKLVDRLQNTRALVACSREKQLRKVAETKKHILPLIDDVAKVYPQIAALLTEKFEAALQQLV